MVDSASARSPVPESTSRTAFPKYEGASVLCSFDESDVADVRARDVVEWWSAEHVEPMLNVFETVERLAPPLDLGDTEITAVSFRPKRFESTVDKLTREPGKLADMADTGGVRAVVDTQIDADQLHGQLARHPRGNPGAGLGTRTAFDGISGSPLTCDHRIEPSSCSSGPSDKTVGRTLSRRRAGLAASTTRLGQEAVRSWSSFVALPICSVRWSSTKATPTLDLACTRLIALPGPSWLRLRL